MTTYLKCFGSILIEKRGFDEKCLSCNTNLLCKPIDLPKKDASCEQMFTIDAETTLSHRDFNKMVATGYDYQGLQN